MMRVKQGGIEYHFWVFGMNRSGIEPLSPGPKVNTLLIRLIARSQMYYNEQNCKPSSPGFKFGLLLSIFYDYNRFT